MVDFFLKLGSINKRLLMPIISAIIYIIMDIIEYFVEMPDSHYVFDFYARGISYILLKLIPIIEKCRSRKVGIKEKKCHCKKTTYDLFFIYLTYLIFFTVIIYLNYLKSKDPKDTDDYKISHYKGLCFEEAVEIIFIVIVSKLLLKMKLYIHHYIGLSIFLVLSLIIDILFNLTIFKPDILFIGIYIIYLILDSIYVTYEKYMMDKLGYSPYNTVFYIGFIFLFTATVGIIILSFTGGAFYNGNNYVIEGIDDYFKKNEYKYVILHMLYLICFRFFLNILKILTVYYFTQIHNFTTYILIKIFDLLLRKDSDYKYFSILLFFFQFLGLLIFLEIIELNFWGLNKNVVRKVEKRLSEENINILNAQENDEDRKETQKIEISPGYLIETEMERFNEMENEIEGTTYE